MLTAPIDILEEDELLLNEIHILFIEIFSTNDLMQKYFKHYKPTKNTDHLKKIIVEKNLEFKKKKKELYDKYNIEDPCTAQINFIENKIIFVEKTCNCNH